MPTIDANKKAWNEMYDWSKAGDEWSSAWGTPEAQWRATILPRIEKYIPVHHILEIAPGYGRWSQFLHEHCDVISLVDLSETCIEACRKRFAAHDHFRYFVNDGRSLDMIEDNSVDFVFSFDSLVHADADAIESYLKQLAKKMRGDSFGFIHHSNLEALADLKPYISFGRMFSDPNSPQWADKSGGGKRNPLAFVFRFFTKIGLMPNLYWRSPTMSAEKFARLAEEAGLACVSQEVVNWYGKHMLDCLSVITRPTSKRTEQCAVTRNPNFMDEARKASESATAKPEAREPAVETK